MSSVLKAIRQSWETIYLYPVTAAPFMGWFAAEGMYKHNAVEVAITLGAAAFAGTVGIGGPALANRLSPATPSAEAEKVAS